MSSKKKQASIYVRCDEDLAAEFKRVVESKGYTQSLILRELMKEYLEKNGQADFFK